MRIKHSYFDYGGEIDICHTYPFDDKPVRLSIRQIKNQYELYARSYWIPEPDAETVIMRGSLEEVVETANVLMRELFGPDWEADVVEPEGFL